MKSVTRRAVAVVTVAERTNVRVPLEDSRDPEALRGALDALVAAVADGAILDAKKNVDLTYFVVSFHLPHGKWIRERTFFARCAAHPSLHPAMLAYVALVNRHARGIGGDLCHGHGHPVGSFAIVPLVLRSPRYVPALVDHLRGWDMDHETFHPSLFEELLVRHGVREETLDLLAWRALESGGEVDLTLGRAVRDHGLLAKLDENGGLEAFVARALRTSERRKGLARRASAAGRALFAGRREDFARWLALFEARGVVFDDADRVPPPAAAPRLAVPAWPDAFEEDDDTTP